MALKIVTGGTTGAANGTLVSSGNPLVVTALNTAIDAHIRCDDGYWTATELFDFTAAYNLQVSFDGGSTWKGSADEPVTAPEIYAVNYPIKLRQTAAASTTAGSFVTNNSTYTAFSALAQVTGASVTRTSGTQSDLSWSAVSNRTYYKIERALDSGFTSSLTTLSSTTTATSYSDTTCSAGVVYYYRVTALGSAPNGRYSDGTASATLTSTPALARTESEISGISDQPVFCCAGPDGNIWVTCQGGDAVGRLDRVTPGGTVTVYSLGSVTPSGICSDGTNLWIVTNTSLIKSTTSGSLTSYTTGLNFAKREIVYHDSYLWLTDTGGHTIKKVNPADGTVSATYTPSGTTPLPYGICAGPDESGSKYIWFTLYSANKVGKLKCSDGTITLYSLTTGTSGPVSICSDGTNLWAAQQITNKIVKITTAGTVTEYSAPSSPAAGDPCHICYGPDSKLWFTYSSNASKIGSCSTAGSFDSMISTTGTSNPQDICVGPDGISLYAPLYSTDKLAKVV